ncbi:hypothetical protein C8F01DRAFT_271088 [Mycena amicta]|nr:hypothetical protein C8F01DRAFT_271088 [Mycena amicta]
MWYQIRMLHLLHLLAGAILVPVELNSIYGSMTSNWPKESKNSTPVIVLWAFNNLYFCVVSSRDQILPNTSGPANNLNSSQYHGPSFIHFCCASGLGLVYSRSKHLPLLTTETLGCVEFRLDPLLVLFVAVVISSPQPYFVMSNSTDAGPKIYAERSPGSEHVDIQEPRGVILPPEMELAALSVAKDVGPQVAGCIFDVDRKAGALRTIFRLATEGRRGGAGAVVIGEVPERQSSLLTVVPLELEFA